MILSARGSACCDAASREIYRSGFQSASLETILASARVTKGALYHHFKNKEALGYAVVEEIISPDVDGKWVRPLQSVKDPIGALIAIVQELSVRPEDVCGGCQLNNLAQEMSPLDAGFRKRLGDHLRCLARGGRESFARGTETRKRSPRRGTCGRRGLADCDGRRLWFAGEEYAGSESDKGGNQKHRGLAEFSAPAAGQPQARLMASFWFETGYIPIGS